MPSNLQLQLPIVKIQRLVELDRQYDAIKKERDTLRAELLAVTKALGVLSLKTEGYTISRVTKLLTRVSDFTTLKESLDRENIPYEVEEAFTPQMSVLFKEIAKSKKELDGLEVTESEFVVIRTPKELEVK